MRNSASGSCRRSSSCSASYKMLRRLLLNVADLPQQEWERRQQSSSNVHWRLCWSCYQVTETVCQATEKIAIPVCVHAYNQHYASFGSVWCLVCTSTLCQSEWAERENRCWVRYSLWRTVLEQDHDVAWNGFGSTWRLVFTGVLSVLCQWCYSRLGSHFVNIYPCVWQ